MGHHMGAWPDFDYCRLDIRDFRTSIDLRVGKQASRPSQRTCTQVAARALLEYVGVGTALYLHVAGLHSESKT